MSATYIRRDLCPFGERGCGRGDRLIAAGGSIVGF